MGSQVVDFLLFDRAAAQYSGDDLTRFLSTYTAVLNLADILFLALLAGPLLRRFGLRLGLTFNPALVGGILAVMAVVSAAAGVRPSRCSFSHRFFALVISLQPTARRALRSMPRTRWSRPGATRGAIRRRGHRRPFRDRRNRCTTPRPVRPRSRDRRRDRVRPLPRSVRTGVAVILYRSYTRALADEVRQTPLPLVDLEAEESADVRALLMSEDARDIRLGLDLLAGTSSSVLETELRRIAAHSSPEVRVRALGALRNRVSNWPCSVDDVLLSYGRMDQYLYPYYLRDVEKGILTEESAIELLNNLWIKTLTINKIRSWSHTQYSAGSPLYQNVTIGGQTTDKKDAVNGMSYMILKSVAQCHLTQPNLTVRYHRGLDNDFMKECIEVVKQGFGMPAFNNDEIIIPSFIARGIAEEDAYNYSAIGCVEVAVPGKWGYRCTGMSFINFPKTLLIAMNDGVDPASGKQLVEGTGHFTDMASFEDVKHAWEVTIKAITKHSVVIENAIDNVLEKECPDVLLSALCDDCIGRGKTLKEGGAIYDFVSGLQVGIANLADSLAAIKKCVYEDQTMTRAELWDALMNNFAGERGEEIRQILINDAPKYGNDDDYVDQLVVDAYQVYIDEIKKYPNTRYGRGPIGGTRYAGTSSISANVGQGKGTMATPDGRKAGTPLSEGCSPSHSMDINGPTAVFKTVSKLNTREITGGVLLNQKVSPQMLAKEADSLKLIAMIRTFFNRLNGFHVQYNVVSRDTLIDAQKHPENHRDLIVRVAGYSAFFTVLSKATQDDIIARTEHSLA